MGRKDEQNKAYIIGIDQSTQGTKALLLNGCGRIVARAYRAHRQIVDEHGWVEHDPEEIYLHTVEAVRDVVNKSGIDKGIIAGIGISNQRETALIWDKSGKPVYNAIVWQCTRGQSVCDRIAARSEAADEGLFRELTGLPLSPYFSAAKIAWLLEHVPGIRERAERGELCCGTMDTYLVYRLTGGEVYRTDYSNASRTQLFNIRTLAWDEKICGLFGIPVKMLAEAADSDACYGRTDAEGFFHQKIPIHGVLGDSNAALFGQGCLRAGAVKATYGTGSSVMMNVGPSPVSSAHGLAASLAYCIGGKVSYVLEGNINYTGAVITWLQKDLGMIESAEETSALAKQASAEDSCYLVPAFSGLGAPYWNSRASGLLTGITRRTKKAEVVRAALECIAYQITDILHAMEEDAGIVIRELRADGGPSRNEYLMQFQSDIVNIPVCVPVSEELSGIGAAYAAGLGLGIYRIEELFAGQEDALYVPGMEEKVREEKYAGWKNAVERVLYAH